MRVHDRQRRTPANELIALIALHQNPTSNSVSVFDTLNGDVLLTTITGGGLNVPTAVALDNFGNLYVTNSAGNSVSVFTANGYTPATVVTSSTITGHGLNLPEGVATDANGKLYVANFGSNSVSVLDTLHGNALLTTIAGGLDGPTGVVIR